MLTVAQPKVERFTTRWSPEKLLARARSAAAGIGPWEPSTPLSERRYWLLDRTEDHELWVIYWPEARGLTLHDHGGSAGAFHVVGGVLEEKSTTLRGLRLRRRLLDQGQGRSFGPGYVHSVVNPQAAPATSVHAYSPPLTSMTFYTKSSTGLVMSRVVTEWEGAPPD